MSATATATSGVDQEVASLRFANQQQEPEPATPPTAWPDWLTPLVWFWMGAAYALATTGKYSWPLAVTLVALTVAIAYALTIAFRLVRRSFRLAPVLITGGRVWGILHGPMGYSICLGTRSLPSTREAQ